MAKLLELDLPAGIKITSEPGRPARTSKTEKEVKELPTPRSFTKKVKEERKRSKREKASLAKSRRCDPKQGKRWGNRGTKRSKK